MYQYNEYDHQMLTERVAQFRDQTSRYLDGKLTETEFLPLRLQNGLYVQRLAPMLRVAIPMASCHPSSFANLHLLPDITIRVTAISPRVRIVSSTGRS